MGIIVSRPFHTGRETMNRISSHFFFGNRSAGSFSSVCTGSVDLAQPQAPPNSKATSSPPHSHRLTAGPLVRKRGLDL